MATTPHADADVPAFAASLGVAGLVDIHTHFMPERVMAKVWAFFDAVPGPQGGPGWPIQYRGTPDERLAAIRSLGIRTFTSLAYAHKPDMAEWLNGWTRDFAADKPDCVHAATFYPEPGVDRYVAEAIDAGAGVFKVHLQVGDFDPRHPLLEPVWARLADTGVPVVIHCGSGPHGGTHTGPGPISQVLDTHPDLTLVIAHMGMPEYTEFFGLALRYPNVHLDTTMVFTDYMERIAPYPRCLRGMLATHPERIVLGSDFPNIPYPYAEQLRALADLELGDGWLRAVCHDNGARLLGRI